MSQPQSIIEQQLDNIAAMCMELLRKANTLAEVQGQIVVHVDGIEKQMKNKPQATAPQQAIPQPEQLPPRVTVRPDGGKTVAATNQLDATIALLPPELASMLRFNDKGSYIDVRPNQFLGAENFSKIASVVRGVGGKYVSAGRDSHFEIPAPTKRSN
jgi:hypothetical protein